MENRDREYQRGRWQRVEFDEEAARRTNTPRARAAAKAASANNADAGGSDNRAGESMPASRDGGADARAAGRSGGAAGTRSSARSGGTRRSSGSASRTGAARTSRQATSRTSSRSRTGAPAQSRGGRARTSSPAANRPVSNDIWRNRIIAIIAVVVILFLLVNLVSCIAGALGGGDKGASGVSSAAASAASASAASAGEASSASAEAAATAAEGASSGSSAESAAAAASFVQQVGAQAAQRLASETNKAPIVPEGQGVEDQWVEGGRFTTGDAELDQWIKDFCDASTKPELSREENAFNVYCYTVWRDYVERDNNQYPAGADWDIVYAKQNFTDNGGNCYNQVAMAEYVLKYFGYYDAQAEPCLVLRQSGSYGDHGLVFVTNADGRKCLCDPAFGSDGWMLDADVYTMRLIDLGQDRSELDVANFEAVEVAPWLS